MINNQQLFLKDRNKKFKKKVNIDGIDIDKLPELHPKNEEEEDKNKDQHNWFGAKKESEIVFDSVLIEEINNISVDKNDNMAPDVQFKFFDDDLDASLLSLENVVINIIEAEDVVEDEDIDQKINNIRKKKKNKDEDKEKVKDKNKDKDKDKDKSKSKNKIDIKKVTVNNKGNKYEDLETNLNNRVDTQQSFKEIYKYGSKNNLIMLANNDINSMRRNSKTMAFMQSQLYQVNNNQDNIDTDKINTSGLYNKSKTEFNFQSSKKLQHTNVFNNDLETGGQNEAEITRRKNHRNTVYNKSMADLHLKFNRNNKMSSNTRLNESNISKQNKINNIATKISNQDLYLKNKY